MFQFVEFAEVLFPGFVDDVEQDALLKGLDHLFTFALVSRLEAAGDVVHALAVGDGDEDVFIHLSTLFIDLFDDGIGYLCHPFGLALETLHRLFEGLLGQLLTILFAELLFGEGGLDSQALQEFELAILVGGYLDSRCCAIPDHVDDIHTDTLTHQGVATLGVNHATLLVHHIIVLQQTLTDTKVVLFHLLLGALDGFGDHVVLNHLTLLEAELVHYRGDAVAGEEAHEVVFQ